MKQFAQIEVTEQEMIAEVLKSIQSANVSTGQGAATNVKAKVDEWQNTKASFTVITQGSRHGRP